MGWNAQACSCAAAANASRMAHGLDVLAALGVFGIGAAWPDLVVAAVMGLLALSGAWTVLQQARRELRVAKPRLYLRARDGSS